MLQKLNEVIKQIPELMDDKTKWKSLLINKRKPHTYRIFRRLDDGTRVCLHLFEQCAENEAFKHPHPWPGAFQILKGSYKMWLGRSDDRFSQPKDVCSIIMTEGSKYEITDPLTWHSVIPLEDTMTIMVNDIPWDEETVAHIHTPRTKNVDLDKIPENEFNSLYRFFQNTFYNMNKPDARFND